MYIPPNAIDDLIDLIRVLANPEGSAAALKELKSLSEQASNAMDAARAAQKDADAKLAQAKEVADAVEGDRAKLEAEIDAWKRNVEVQEQKFAVRENLLKDRDAELVKRAADVKGREEAAQLLADELSKKGSALSKREADLVVREGQAEAHLKVFGEFKNRLGG